MVVNSEIWKWLEGEALEKYVQSWLLELEEEPSRFSGKYSENVVLMNFTASP